MKIDGAMKVKHIHIVLTMEDGSRNVVADRAVDCDASYSVEYGITSRGPVKYTGEVDYHVTLLPGP